jgi:hypothetical protein
MINEFRNSKELLWTSIISTHYDPAERVCVFPDASDKHWGLFITQVPNEDLEWIPFEDQRHSPLLIMSGSFKSGSVNWHIKEKEAYPILVALEKARDIFSEIQMGFPCSRIIRILCIFWIQTGGRF